MSARAGQGGIPQAPVDAQIPGASNWIHLETINNKFPVISAASNPGGFLQNHFPFLVLSLLPQRIPHSPSPDAPECQGVERLARDIPWKNPFPLLCHSFVKSHVKEFQLREFLRVLDQGRGFPCAWRGEGNKE